MQIVGQIAELEAQKIPVVRLWSFTILLILSFVIFFRHLEYHQTFRSNFAVVPIDEDKT